MNKKRKAIFLYIGLLAWAIFSILAIQYDISGAMARGWLSDYTWSNYLGIIINGILMGSPGIIIFSFAYFGYYYIFGSIMVGISALLVWQASGGYDIHGTVSLVGMFISFVLGIGLELLAVLIRLFLPMFFPSKYKDPFLK